MLRTLTPSLRILFRSVSPVVKKHEWIDDVTFQVGISKHAAEQLGDVVFIQLPELNSNLSQGDQLGALESVKAASDVYSPASGTVVDINKELIDEPSKLNPTTAETTAWLCKLKVDNKGSLSSLMDLASYEKYVKEHH